MICAAISQAFVIRLLSQCIYGYRDLTVSLTSPGNAATVNKVGFMTLASTSGRVPKEFIEGVIALMCFGFAVGSLIVAGDLLPQIFLDLYPDAAGALVSRYVWIVLVSVGIGLPTMFLPSLGSLKPITFLGNLGLAYIIVIVSLIGVGILDSGANSSCNPLGLETSISYGVGPMSFTSLLSTFSIYIASFSCAQNVPQLLFELENSTQKRADQMIVISTSVSFVFTIVTGIAGYLSYGQYVCSDLIKSFPSTSIAITARIAILLCVIASYSLSMHPSRENIISMLCQTSSTNCPRKEYLLVTMGSFLCSVGLALAVENLDVTLSFIGATAGVGVGFTFPTYFYLAHHFPSKGWSPTTIASFVILVCSLLLIPLLVTSKIFELVN